MKGGPHSARFFIEVELPENFEQLDLDHDLYRILDETFPLILFARVRVEAAYDETDATHGGHR